MRKIIKANNEAKANQKKKKAFSKENEKELQKLRQKLVGFFSTQRWTEVA